MSKGIFIISFMVFSFHLLGASGDDGSQFEITSRIAAVGGDGNQNIYVETNQQEKISLFFFSDTYGGTHKKVNDICEKYLLMKMEKGYSKVRIINVSDIKRTTANIEIYLDKNSYCMLQN